MASKSPTTKPDRARTDSSSDICLSPALSPLPFESSNLLSSSILSKQPSTFDLSPVLYSARVSKTTLKLHQLKIEALTARESVDPLDRIRKILKDKHRSKEDASVLYEFFHNTKFFKEFRDNNSHRLHEDQALAHICRRIKYESAPIGKVVCEKGNTDGKTFIILTGEVCRINSKENTTTNPTPVPTGLSPKKVSSRVSQDSGFTRPSFMRQTSFENKFHQERPLIFNDFADSSMQKTSTSQNYSIEASTKLPGTSFERSLLRDKTPEPVNLFSKRQTQGLIIDEKSEAVLKGQLKIVKMAQPAATTHVKSLSQSIYKTNGDKSRKLLQRKSTISESLIKRTERFGTVLSKLYREDYFGGVEIEPGQQDDMLVVTAECEFMVLNEEVFAYIRKRFERRNAKKINFFMDFLPGLASFPQKASIYNQLCQTKEIGYDINNYITVQGTPANYCYMIFEGVCDLYIKFPEDQSHSELKDYGEQKDHNKQDGIQVCKLSQGMFIGEEAFFSDNKQYEFTVKAASTDVTLIVMDTSLMSEAVSQDFLKALKQMYLTKRQNHIENAMKRMSVKAAVLALMKSPRKKKSQVIKRETIRIEGNLSPSPEELRAFSRCSSKESSPEQDYSSIKISNVPVQCGYKLPKPIVPMLKLQLANTERNKLRLKAFQKTEDEKEPQGLLFSPPRLTIDSPKSKRSRVKSETGNVVKEWAESSSVDNKAKVPKLNLQNLPEMNKELSRQISIKELIKKMKKSQSRSIRLNKNNISISLATERSSMRATQMDDMGKSVENDRVVKRGCYTERKYESNLNNLILAISDTTKATINEKSTYSSRGDRSVISGNGTMIKFKKDQVMANKSKTPSDEQESYGLKPFWTKMSRKLVL